MADRRNGRDGVSTGTALALLSIPVLVVFFGAQWFGAQILPLLRMRPIAPIWWGIGGVTAFAVMLYLGGRLSGTFVITAQGGKRLVAFLGTVAGLALLLPASLWAELYAPRIGAAAAHAMTVPDLYGFARALLYGLAPVALVASLLWVSVAGLRIRIRR
jgi:hypothetical protein